MCSEWRQQNWVRYLKEGIEGEDLESIWAGIKETGEVRMDNSSRDDNLYANTEVPFAPPPLPPLPLPLRRIFSTRTSSTVARKAAPGAP